MRSWFNHDISDQENVVYTSVGIAEDDHSWNVLNIHPNVIVGSVSAIIIMFLVVLGVIICIFVWCRRGRSVISVPSAQPPIITTAPAAQTFPLVVYRQEGHSGSSCSGYRHPIVDEVTGQPVLGPERYRKRELQSDKNSDRLFQLVTMLNQADH